MLQINDLENTRLDRLVASLDFSNPGDEAIAAKIEAMAHRYLPARRVRQVAEDIRSLRALRNRGLSHG